MNYTAVDLESLTDDEYRAIELEAIKRGVSFDEALKQMLLEVSRRVQKASPNPLRHRLAH
jgi:hypothetical protein